MAVSANRLELLQIADAVAREKTIDRMIVVAAMEDAIQKAARSRYGSETDIRAEINPKTGEIKLQRLLKVVETIENPADRDRRSRTRARRNPAAQVGDFIAEPLPPMDFGRIAAQSAKQVIVQKVREAERDRQYEEFKDRIGEIVNGQVKRVEYGNVIVDLGRGEGIVRRDELIPRETFRYGDRVRAYIYDVRREQRGPQIFLSRTHPAVHGQAVRAGSAGDLRRHHRGQVGRPRSGLAAPRSPSSRAIPRSIRSAPASACAAAASRRSSTSCRARRSTSSRGRRTPPPSSSTRCSRPRSPRSSSTRRPSASRWSCPTSSCRSPSAAAARTCASPRSSPAGTSTSSPSRRNRSAARRNSRSARSSSSTRSTSTRWSASCSPRKASPSVEEIAYVDLDDLAAIEGFDEETAGELQTRARDYLDKLEAEQDAERKALGVEDALKEVPGMTTAMLVALGKDDIKTVEDFAGSIPDELVGWVERKDGEATRHRRRARRLRPVARRRRGDDHGRPASRPAGSPRPTSTRRPPRRPPPRPAARRPRRVMRNEAVAAPQRTDRTHLHRHPRGEAGRTQLIRFVVAPDGDGRPRPSPPLAGPRRLGDARRPTMVRDGGAEASVRQRPSTGRSTVEPGLADRVDALCSPRPPAPCRWRARPATLVGGFAKVEAALAARAGRRR